jgi:hypothetical protein
MPIEQKQCFFVLNVGTWDTLELEQGKNEAPRVLECSYNLYCDKSSLLGIRHTIVIKARHCYFEELTEPFVILLLFENSLTL